MGDGISSNTSPVVSIREIILKHNLKISPNAPKVLTRSTLYRYVNKTNGGVSPLKMEPPTKIPLCYEKIFALHVRMVQNSIGNFLNIIIIIITSSNYICITFLYFFFIFLFYISFIYYYCIIYVVICNKQENYVLMKLKL